MQMAIWKLTAMAAVTGVGLLAVIQARQSLVNVEAEQVLPAQPATMDIPPTTPSGATDAVAMQFLGTATATPPEPATPLPAPDADLDYAPGLDFRDDVPRDAIVNADPIPQHAALASVDDPTDRADQITVRGQNEETIQLVQAEADDDFQAFDPFDTDVPDAATTGAAASSPSRGPAFGNFGSEPEPVTGRPVVGPPVTSRPVTEPTARNTVEQTPVREPFAPLDKNSEPLMELEVPRQSVEPRPSIESRQPDENRSAIQRVAAEDVPAVERRTPAVPRTLPDEFAPFDAVAPSTARPMNAAPETDAGPMTESFGDFNNDAGFGFNAEPATGNGPEPISPPNGFTETPSVERVEPGIRSPAVPSSAEVDDFDPFGNGAPAAGNFDDSRPMSLDALGPPGNGAPLPSTATAPAAQPKPAVDEFVGTGTVPGEVVRTTQQPAVKIEKHAPEQAVVGESMVYTIVVRNVGNQPVQRVIVEDEIPRGTRLTGTVPRAEMVDKRLVWQLGELAPDQEQKISIRVEPTEEGRVGSVATVRFVTEVAAVTKVSAPRLTLDISAPPKARLGETVTLNFVLKNEGTADASDVVIRAVLPQNLRNEAGGDLEYSVGTLPVGKSIDVQLPLAAMAAGHGDCRAIVTSAGKVSVDEAIPLKVTAPRLSIRRNGAEKMFVGRITSFSNSVTNDGEDPVETITVLERVPDEFEFVHASDDGKYDSVSRTVSWSVGPLAPREGRLLKVQYRPVKPGTVRTSVVAKTAGANDATINSDSKIEGFASLAVEPLADGTPVLVGERIRAQLKVVNKGTATARDVVLRMRIPAELKLLAANGPVPARQAGDIVEFDPIPTVAPQSDTTINLEFEAIQQGIGRVLLQMEADYLTKPLSREEAFRVLPQE